MEELADSTLKPIVFKTPHGFVYLDYDDIILCSANRNCSDVFTIESNDPIRILHKILFIEKKYCNDKFIRCHKSHIINLKYIESLSIKTHQIHLKNGYIVPLSYDCWKKLKRMSIICISDKEI